ncbi:MAG: aminodeoxychorismate/anthranilate synthase component II [Methanosarcinales archaeon]|nr:aminodeoxychorismate/anthranilate synthase component II [Methanosarcinales archaeon]
MTKILFVNNKDSFVWNLVEYVSIFEPDTIVVPNTITLDEVREIDPDGIVISPGPGNPNDPKDIGSCIEIIRACEVPLLGVCLGCQAINVAFGGTVGHASVGPVHGKASEIHHDGIGIYAGLPNPFTGGRYHSLAVERVSPDLEVVAHSPDGVVMGIRHKRRPIEGVQFHPESVLTPDGLGMIERWVGMVAGGA